MYVPRLKTIRASPEGTNQSREAPVPIIFESGISVFILHSELAFPRTVSTPHSLPNHHPLTILLPQPLPRAQTRLQATGTGTEEETSSHAHLTSASSNPLAALPTGGIMGPPTAHGLRTIISPLQFLQRRNVACFLFSFRELSTALVFLNGGSQWPDISCLLACSVLVESLAMRQVIKRYIGVQ